MPEFKTHSNAGIAAGYIGGMSGIYFLKLPVIYGIILFSSLYAGSIFPDIDSDNSTTFNVIFTIISLIAAFISIPFINFMNREIFLLIPGLIFIFTRFVVGFIFKKFSRHRGIYHSIPMGILISLIIFYISSKKGYLWKISTGEAFLVSAFFMSGFFVHLFLDEVNSIFDFETFKFQWKSSFGTAITLKGNGLLSTVFVYFLIFVFIFLSFDNLMISLKYLKRIF